MGQHGVALYLHRALTLSIPEGPLTTYLRQCVDGELERRRREARLEPGRDDPIRASKENAVCGLNCPRHDKTCLWRRRRIGRRLDALRDVRPTLFLNCCWRVRCISFPVHSAILHEHLSRSVQELASIRWADRTRFPISRRLQGLTLDPVGKRGRFGSCHSSTPLVVEVGSDLEVLTGGRMLTPRQPAAINRRHGIYVPFKVRMIQGESPPRSEGR
mmetsp:Transcript_43385/g.114283  ORF Transcript_43385/g.114283 Transcript_43385/m.114283 type:complete len:216 (+) Transcript_43385:569-1216(+)